MARKHIPFLAIALLVIVASLGAILFRYKTRDLILDSARVEEMAARFLPGARPLPGCGGAVGMEKELLQVAIFAPSPTKARPGTLQGQELRILIAQIKTLPTDVETLDKWHDFVKKISADREAQGVKTLEKRPLLIRLAGRPQPFLRSVSEINSLRFVEFTTVFPIAGKPVVLMIMGPEATFNQQAMDTFLGRLEIPKPHRPTAPTPASPQPPDGPPFP